MKLTAEQIQYIHDFVKRKYVDYYDVQIELVDHIATSIEEKIDAKPALDFPTALQQISDSFGMFGFIEFVEEKEKQVQRRFNKMHTREWLKFFTIPKIAFTIMLIFLCYQTFLFLNPNILKFSFAGVYIVFLLFQIAYLFCEQKKQREKLISWNTPFKMSNLFLIVIQFSSLGFYGEISSKYPFASSMIIAIGLVSYLAEINAMMNISAEQRRLYPEAFAV